MEIREARNHARRAPVIWALLGALVMAGAVLVLLGQISVVGVVLAAATGLAGWIIARHRARQDGIPAAPVWGVETRPVPLIALEGGVETGQRAPSLAAVLEQLPDPALLLDAEARIVLANAQTRQIFRSAAPGRPITSAIRTPSVLDAIEQVRGGAPAQAVEYTLLVPFERHLEVFVAPISDSGLSGRGDGWPVLVVIHDLTSMKRLEQMRVDFVASASHELRTPLASLTGFIETLRGPARDDPEAQDRFLGIMTEQAARMGRLINDLLSLSRIELNEHVTPGDEVDMDQVVPSVVEALSPMAAEAEVQVMVSGASDGLLLGDADELTQVVQNLLDIAIHYGGGGGRVDVVLSNVPATERSAPVRRLVRIAVRDYGQGIDREHIPRLTERFYRIDVRKSRRQGSTGLGLAIVKHIVNRHRGWLEVQSARGEGSTFIVTLPLIDQALAPVEDAVQTITVPEPREPTPNQPIVTETVSVREDDQAGAGRVEGARMSSKSH